MFRAVHVDCFTIVLAEFVVMKTMNRNRVGVMLQGDEVCERDSVCLCMCACVCYRKRKSECVCMSNKRKKPKQKHVGAEIVL